MKEIILKWLENKILSLERKFHYNIRTELKRIVVSLVNRFLRTIFIFLFFPSPATRKLKVVWLRPSCSLQPISSLEETAQDRAASSPGLGCSALISWSKYCCLDQGHLILNVCWTTQNLVFLDKGMIDHPHEVLQKSQCRSVAIW